MPSGRGAPSSDWAISGAIKALRTPLDGQSKDKQYVRTIHSTGYRFIADALAGTQGAPSADAKTLVRLSRALSGAADTAYLADGLSEDLVAGLSRQGSIRVLSYNTSRAFADTEPPKTVGITHLVDGSVRLFSDIIRVNVSVIDGEGLHQI
jgi:hypothetical protein